ncbi:MAG: 50S ribosomal protein L15, partial [Deltaproteobacteria bacterium]|nr:50S ribosomal protein L15 [Deltaproteobacteria bacterium]
SGRGHKGQKARAGGFHKRGFEGGQMPLQRRLPKRGFTNIFAKVYTIVNLDTLEKMEGLKEVTLETLTAQGVVRKERSGLKILGRGNITRPLVVKAHACSAEAKRKIEASGGQVEVIGG